jgi:amidohydrolase
VPQTASVGYVKCHIVSRRFDAVLNMSIIYRFYLMSIRFAQLVTAILFATVAEVAAAEGWVEQAAKDVNKDVIAWRHDIHQHPELGNMEFRTSELIAQKLESFGLDVRRGVGKTGVVGILKGQMEGPVVALRADMDALPVKEETGLPYASQAKGIFHGREVDVMHACGHDAHVAMLLGAAKIMATNRGNIAGTVVFIFQPAEEGAADIDVFAQPDALFGARGMIEEGVLDNPKVEAMFGLHVMAGMDSGHLFYKKGATLNSSDSFRVTLQGKQTHGSMPWAGTDSIVAGSQVVNAMQTLVSRHADLSKGSGVVSVGSIHAGTAGNVIPELLTMEGTIRSNHPEIRSVLLEKLPAVVNNTAEANLVNAEVQIASLMPVTINDEALTEVIVPGLRKAADGKLQALPATLAPSEDFAFYAEKVPSLYVFLGVSPPESDASKVAMNHNPKFLVDDDALITGVRAHVEFVLAFAEAR